MSLKTIIEDLLPFLKSAAEKAFDKLPANEQAQLKQISTAVQVIKLCHEQGKSVQDTVATLVATEGLDPATLEAQLISYVEQKGEKVANLNDAVTDILNDASTRGKTGLNALWVDITTIVANVYANIDWSALLMGLVQFAYEEFVQGKVKI